MSPLNILKIEPDGIADLTNMRIPAEETGEAKLSEMSVPRLRTTVAIIQDYTDPESFLVVDFALCLALQRLDRQSFEIASMIDGNSSVQEIIGKLNGPMKDVTQQGALEFFEFLHSIGAIDL
jgi:hypothetical protein